MCGIVGFWDRARKKVASEAVLRSMMDLVRHRGPDDSGVWIDDSVALGHTRLSILDLSSRGHQPSVTSDGSGVLVYNGEVYNYPQLRARLEQEGVHFASTCDTEVVLYALHTWGPERAIPMFNGMFGLAYFDLRERALWVARDRLGIKPVYLAERGDTVVFGSEMKAVIDHPLVGARADMHSLMAQVLCMRLEGEWTPFEGVRALLPGSYIKFSEDESRETRYFDVIADLDPSRIVAAGGTGLDVFADSLDQLFRDSVSMHLASDAPVATMCSGGVDSSMITAVAKEVRPDIVAYVADVKGGVSEGEKAARIARHLDIPLHQIDVEPEQFLRLWATAAWHNDQPSFHPSDAPFLAVARACRRDGIKVILTGEGADEIFGGYPWQEEVYRMWRLRRLQSRLVPDRQPWRAFGRVLNALIPRNWRPLETMPFSYSTSNDLLSGVSQHSTAQFVQQLAAYGDQRLVRHEAVFQRLASIEPIEDRAFLARCLDDLYGYLQILLQRNDRMGMAASIESRFPFLENGVIDFGIHLPLSAKFSRGTGKCVVRRVAASMLPQATITEQKQGFAVPNDNWKAGLGLLRGGRVADLFKWGADTERALIPRIADQPRMLYSMTSMELWARIFLDGESPEALGERLVAESAKGGS